VQGVLLLEPPTDAVTARDKVSPENNKKAICPLAWNSQLGRTASSGKSPNINQQGYSIK